jgi:hypothetical protein
MVEAIDSAVEFGVLQHAGMESVFTTSAEVDRYCVSQNGRSGPTELIWYQLECQHDRAVVLP